MFEFLRTMLALAALANVGNETSGQDLYSVECVEDYSACWLETEIGRIDHTYSPIDNGWFERRSDGYQIACSLHSVIGGKVIVNGSCHHYGDLSAQLVNSVR